MKTATGARTQARFSTTGGECFSTRAFQVETTGGEISANEDSPVVTGADEAILIYTAASSHNGFDKDPVREGADARKKASAFLDAASKRDLPDLLDRHTGTTANSSTA